MRRAGRRRSGRDKRTVTMWRPALANCTVATAERPPLRSVAVAAPGSSLVNATRTRASWVVTPLMRAAGARVSGAAAGAGFTVITIVFVDDSGPTASD